MAKILGITDERTTCECCGKANLKRTTARCFPAITWQTITLHGAMKSKCYYQISNCQKLV